MSIFGPFSSRTTSAVTLILASAAASDVTAVPSTRRSAGSSTVSPAAAASRSTTTTSPTATFSWRPPAFTIAYTTLLLISARRTACHHAQSKLSVPCRRPRTSRCHRWTRFPWGFASAPLAAARMISAHTTRRRSRVRTPRRRVKPDGAARGRRDLSHVLAGVAGLGSLLGGHGGLLVGRLVVVRGVIGRLLGGRVVGSDLVGREHVGGDGRELELLDLPV